MLSLLRPLVHRSLLVCLAAAAGARAAPPEAPAHAAENAVVKVFATVARPDLGRPWTKEAPVEVSGSGVVIEGKRILTNAHIVAYASQLQIQANQSGDKLSASVAAVAPGIDLAVLKLDDESFFATHAPLPRASALPLVKDAVLAYGYPAGGTSLSITKGIVSRIEFVPYQFGTFGLRIQIDAAINPGNSGGPAMAGDRMIGLAFSHLKNSENIGYIVPDEEIELFLKQVASGSYAGSKPTFRGETQSLQNPALRAFLKLDSTVHGVVVRRTFDQSASAVLRQWDVITRIADTPIDDEGMINVAPGLRLLFTYMVQKTVRNGAVPLTIVRAGKTLHVDAPVPAHYPMLIDALMGRNPQYFIYGPLVFETATQDFVGARGKDLGPLLVFVGSPLMTELSAPQPPERSELVAIAAPFFPHKISKGYGSPMGAVVKTVNGTAVKSLAHLVELLRDLKDEFVTFEFDGRLGEALVFRREEMLSTTEQILTDNGVRAQGSADMLKIWQAK